MCQRVADTMPPDDEVGMVWTYPSPDQTSGARRPDAVVPDRKARRQQLDGPSGLSPPPST